MKKITLIIIGISILILFGLFIFKKIYFSEKAIQERKIKTWNERINELRNSKSGKIGLGKGIFLKWIIKDFNVDEHKIDYYNSIDARYISKIDKKDWYGSDFKMDFPKNELKDLTICINNKCINLDVSQMFNPNLTGELIEDQFKIEKHSNYYILYGFFSDGAGSYTTNWKIEGEKSERSKLSCDEKDFEWQLTK